MIEKLREKALRLPLKPGVYLMRDINGEIIYVGKAKQLKNRVSSYFHGAHNAKTEAMISKIADFSVIIASSEFEALVLENSLIKHHMPKYNILLKDDKGYPFVRLDIKKPYPVFEIAATRENDGAMYFGPFGGRSVTRTAVDAVLKAVKLPTCSRKFPADIGKERPCLNHHLGLCDAYCLPGKAPDMYRDALYKAVMIMSGKTGELLRDMKAQMEEAAEELRFEDAARIRDAINAITALETKQRVWQKSSPDTDAVGFFRGAAKSCFTVLHYINGQLLGKDMELIADPVESDGEALSYLIRQYYAGRETVPKEVLLPAELEDKDDITRFLTEMAGRSVELLVPKRGVNRDWVTAAEMNAQEETIRATTQEERVNRTAKWLMDALGLEKPPVRIEAFDISNTGNSNIVAAMTVFEQGKPKKSAYRKFSIKTTDGQDDYGSMREAVRRRFERYLAGDEKFSPLPDILLIDGGDVHAGAAEEVLNELGLSVPTFGMVKDDRHRTRALITARGEEIGISANPAVFSFIGKIQEETHRFAIEFHRAKRSKGLKASKLDGIEGVGEKRKEALLKAFKSIKAISEATEEELQKVVPKSTARAVYNHFHESDGGVE